MRPSLELQGVLENLQPISGEHCGHVTRCRVLICWLDHLMTEKRLRNLLLRESAGREEL